MCMKCMYGELWHDALVAAGNSVMQIWIMRFCNYSCIGTSATEFSMRFCIVLSHGEKNKRENVKRRRIPDRCCEKAPSEIQKKDRWQHDLATSTANKNSQQLLGAAVGCGSRLLHKYHGSSEICIGVQQIPLNYFDCRI